MSEPTTAAGRALLDREAYNSRSFALLREDAERQVGIAKTKVDRAYHQGRLTMLDDLAARGVWVGDEGLRAADDGYEVRTWVGHKPSGIVVLPGHPQLGGRYCQTDGGDWPCAAVREALAATPTPPEIDVERLARALNASVGQTGWARLTPPNAVEEWRENARIIAAAYKEQPDGE